MALYDAMQFMECNVKQDLSITVVADSWLPKSEERKRRDLQAFLTLTGEMIAASGNSEMINDTIRKANEMFGAGLDFGDLEKESVEAQIRLDKLRDVGTFTEQQFGPFIYDPEGNINTEALKVAYAQTAELLRIAHVPTDETDIFASLPLDVMFDDHKEFGEFLTDWLKSAEGRAASAFIRTLARQLADYHLQAEFYRQFKMNEYSKVPQVADMEAEVIANEVAGKQELANKQANAEQDLAPSSRRSGNDERRQSRSASRF
jgi:hypothetical protein